MPLCIHNPSSHQQRVAAFEPIRSFYHLAENYYKNGEISLNLPVIICQQFQCPVKFLPQGPRDVFHCFKIREEYQKLQRVAGGYQPAILFYTSSSLFHEITADFMKSLQTKTRHVGWGGVRLE